MTDTSLIMLLHGEALFRAGQQANYFYLVTRGSIAIVDQAGLGKIREFEPNELFGIPEVLARGKVGFNVIGTRADTSTGIPCRQAVQLAGGHAGNA